MNHSIYLDTGSEFKKQYPSVLNINTISKNNKLIDFKTYNPEELPRLFNDLGIETTPLEPIEKKFEIKGK